MGYDERSEAVEEIESRFIKALEEEGFIETHADLALALRISRTLAEIAQKREEAFRAIAATVIECDYHTIIREGKPWLFVSEKQMKDAPECIVIEEAPDRNGYYIRIPRKT